MTSGTALVANLADAAMVFWRKPATARVDPYSRSAFNIVRFIAEERLALGVLRPTALLDHVNGTT